MLQSYIFEFEKDNNMQQRTTIGKRAYINMPHLNTGSVSGVKYNGKEQSNNSFDSALEETDSLLSKLYKKYSQNLK